MSHANSLCRHGISRIAGRLVHWTVPLQPAAVFLHSFEAEPATCLIWNSFLAGIATT